MHDLRIEGRKIFLDGFEVKDVNGYELKVNGEEQGAELTLKITVQDVVVKPKPGFIGSGGIAHSETLAIVGSANPERVVPMAELEKLLQRHFSNDVTIKIGGAELGRVAAEGIKELQRKAGKDVAGYLKEEIKMFTFQGQSYERPILCCRGCMTPVFKLPEDIDKNERIVDTLLQKAISIHPQPKPQPKDKRVCATCGCVWHIQGNELPFVITEDIAPPVEARIREIVREEIAAQRSDTVTLKVNSQEIGRAAIKAINEVQREAGKTFLNV